MNDTPPSISLSLLVLRAQDPEGLCTFYAALGLRFARERHGSGPEHHASELNGWVFEIYPRAAHETPTTGTRLGFTVPSLSSALDVLREHKGRVIRGPTVSGPSRTAVICDPEGHRVELTERIGQVA